MGSSSELPDLLVALERASDPNVALEIGLDRLAVRLGADVVAAVHAGHILTSAGASSPKLDRQVLEAAFGDGEVIEVDGRAGAEPLVLGPNRDGSMIVVVRFSAPLSAEEVEEAVAMSRVLSLGLRLMARIERKERHLREQGSHQAVLEAILRIQRLISQRQPIDLILEAITAEAAALLEIDVAGIRLLTADGVTHRALASGGSRGNELLTILSDHQLSEFGRRAAAGELEVSSEVVSPGDENCNAWNIAESQYCVVGSPIFDDGVPVGGFFVVTADPQNQAQIDSATLQTFASQASIAFTDASTVGELREAFHDELTGLPTRALFHERLDRAVEHGVARATTTALLFIDLDRFKSVNDTFGHAAGDELLRDVSRRIVSAGRANDRIARLGGDEFAILIEDTTAADAMSAGRRLLAEIGNVVNPSNSAGRCSASIGVAVTGPGCTTTDELLRRADIAMYAVKAQGRSDVAIYEPAMGSSRLDQGAVVESLESALEQDQIIVHYQPIVSLQTRRILGAEALLRRLDPIDGLIYPSSFVRAAETTGMIVPVGRRVLRTACRQVADWLKRGVVDPDFKLSVNLSGRQLQGDSLRQDVVAALNEFGLDPSVLTLEVTESIFIDDADAAGQRLLALKDLGVGLAIDDFGTGFSSLSYLHHYPFDTIKIDRSFITGLGTTSNSGALVKTLIALSQQLAMNTIAEGIESSAELAQLRALRCDQGQGFLFSKPKAAADFEAVLREHAIGVSNV